MRRQHLGAIAQLIPSAGVGVQGIKLRDDLSAFATIGERGAGGLRHAHAILDTVEKEFVAILAIGYVLTANLPRGKRSVHNPVQPLKHSVFLGNPADPSSHGWKRVILLPTLQLPVRSAFGGPVRTTEKITPATVGDQDTEQDVDDREKRG
jgi:hypothetical protein